MILITLYLLVSLGVATAITGAFLWIVNIGLLETPVLWYMRWRDWDLTAGLMWYDGPHYYLHVGPLFASLDPWDTP